MAKTPMTLERRRYILRLLNEDRSINYICRTAKTSLDTIRTVSKDAGIDVKSRAPGNWHQPEMRDRVRALIERGKTLKVISRETGCGGTFINKVAKHYGLKIASGKKAGGFVERERPQDYGFVKGSKPRWDFTGQDIVDTDTRKYREQW